MSKKIPETTIDEILKRTDIVELISSYLSLKQAGKDHVGLCPFHNEKTPSFSVSAQKQLYYCFGCGAGGNAIRFMMDLNGTSFIETLEDLGKRVGINLATIKENKKETSYKKLYDIMDLANNFYNYQLRKSSTKEAPIEYLKNRGFSGEIAKRFQIGWAPPGWDNILNHLINQAIPNDLIMNSGLINESRGKKFDRLRSRITFPIKNRRGQVLGFGGRTINNDKPKYLNSPETNIFNKGSTIYGIHEATTAQKINNLIITEGYLDVISLSQAGLTNVVATLGTAITKSQLNLLFRETEHLIFCFDGDKAGVNAGIKACKISLEMLSDNRQVDFCFLEEDDDPDQLVKKVGPKEFFNHTKKQQIYEFLIDSVKKELDQGGSEAQNVRLVEKVKPFIMQILGQNQKRMAIKKLAFATSFDEQILYKEIIQPTKYRADLKFGKFTNKPLTERLANLVIQYPDLTKFINNKDFDFLNKLKNSSKNIKTIIDITEIYRIKPATASDIFNYLEESNLDKEQLFGPLTLSRLDAEKEFIDGMAKLIEKTTHLEISEIYKIPFERWTEEQKETVRKFTSRRQNEPMN
ncbi:MAG: DNA primase [Pseudomonadota bacterium]|nr:DNA primase [Pseudomonadota bacterium]